LWTVVSTPLLAVIALPGFLLVAFNAFSLIHAVISAFEKGKQWDGALGLLQEIVHQLLMPDVVSWNAAISTCEKGKQWEEALGLLQEMVHLLLTPDVVS
jgi:pentatricopeptide repeat protein